MGGNGDGEGSGDGRLTDQGTGRSPLRDLPGTPGHQIASQLREGREEIRIPQGDHHGGPPPLALFHETGQRFGNRHLSGAGTGGNEGAHHHQFGLPCRPGQRLVGRSRALSRQAMGADAGKVLPQDGSHLSARSQVCRACKDHMQQAGRVPRIHGDEAVPVSGQSDGPGRCLVGEGQMLPGSDDFSDVVQADPTLPVESNPGLHLQNPPYRCVESGSGYPAGFHGGLHRVQRLPDVSRSQEDVGPGLQGQDRRLPDPVSVRDRSHAHGVGQNEPLEPHLVTEKLGEEEGGEGGWGAVGSQDPRHRHVSRHHGIHTLLHGPPEGDELKGLKAIPVRIHNGKSHMGIGLGVPMPGEVFCGSEDASLSGSGDVCGPQPSDGLGVLPERAGVDNGVEGVGVDVQDRGEVQMDPNGPCFQGGDAAILPGEAFIMDGAKGHGGGEGGPSALGEEGGEGIAVVDAHSGAPVFEVGGHQKGHLGPGLEGVQLRPVGVGQPDGDGDPTHPGLLHITVVLLELRPRGGGVGPGHPGNDELADGLPQGEGGEGLIYPGTAFGVQLSGQGLLGSPIAFPRVGSGCASGQD